MSTRATLRAAAVAGLLLIAGLSGPPVAATPAHPDQVAHTDSVPAGSVPAAAQQGVANAAAHDVRQSVAVIDRTTGRVLADLGGEQIYATESITKLFTAAYYLERAQGQPSTDLAAELNLMIAVSDDGVQSSLWRRDIVPTVARRYGLTASTNAPNANGENWGSDRTTANDQVTFLLRASQDPWVGPSLLPWMAAAEPTGADGFDQSFGVLALPGNRGAKQGWSDQGWSPANLHSVGWTDHHFIAILQSSAVADNETMRTTATFTAQLIGGPGGAFSTPTPTSTPTSTPASTPTAAPEPGTTAPSSTPEPVPVSPVDADPTPAAGEPAAIAALGRAVLVAVAESLLHAFRG